MTDPLSTSLSPENRVFCVGVDSMTQASAAAAIRPIISTIGRLRRTAGWASRSWICRRGLAKRSGRAGVADGVRALLMVYTGMLMMSL
ncbi:hypothetical protein MGWOODY_Smn298 [hydrothermal vent metagenome]|uniref:Uncharacterized protein n=1 Tax=hydrothermal vent metagenome TaxID=652676 RepID=A0A160TJ33_9ZZZZ